MVPDNAFQHSLMTPWWLYWIDKQERGNGDRGHRRANPFLKILTEVYREYWSARLRAVLEERNLSVRAFRVRMNWEEWVLRKLDRGRFDASGGLPPLYLRTMAITLGVSSWELEPTDRELFVEATYRLCTQNTRRQPISRADAEAYVEYFFQWPVQRTGRLDSAAAERAFPKLQGTFFEHHQLAEAIKRTARALDDYLLNHPFFQNRS